MSTGNTTILIQQVLDSLVIGDAQAKKELIDLAYERLVFVARKLLGSFVRVRVEEETTGIVNEAYLRLNSSLEHVKPTTVRQFIGLASLEIRRVLLDTIRRMDGRGASKRKAPLRLDANPSELGNAPAGLEIADPDYDESRRIQAIDLLEAVERLPVEERETVELLFLHGYSQPEAGEVLGVHEDTVKRRWARARVILSGVLSAF